MRQKILSIVIKIAKYTGITAISILLLLFILPFFFTKSASEKIKTWTNSNLNGEMNFSDVKLSFFQHFPALTLTLHDFSLKGAKPFQQDTLLAAKEVSFGVDIKSILEPQLHVDRIYLSNAHINVQVSEKGEANYNVYTPKKDSTQAASKDTTGMALKIEQILISKSNVVYNDRSLDMLIKAKGFNYEGKGDLSKAIFNLYTKAEIDSLDFTFAKTPYVKSKRINAELITKINTNSLSFVFEKNDLKINKLPVKFNGKFEFLKDGYDMDFKLSAKETTLHDMFTALPPEYLGWLEKTQVEGQANIVASLIGKYIAKTKTMPSLKFNMNVRNGLIAYEKVPSPVKNLYLNFESSLPGLNPDSLHVNIDSIYFNIDKDYFSSIVRVKGIKNPYIYANINSNIDLDKWNRAYGIDKFKVKGRYELHLLADGQYKVGIDTKSMRKKDTVILSVPKFKLTSSMRDGYFKYAALPQAMDNISFDINAACPDNNFKNAHFAIENMNANVLKNYVKGFFKVNGAAGFPMEAGLKAFFDLADLQKVFPIKKEMELAGVLNMDLDTKGKYAPAKKQFPHTQASITLKNGRIKTPYYPNPIENIQVLAQASDKQGNMRDLMVNIQPFTFSFEGKPFSVTAKLKNFENLNYAIKANGVLDIGKIYQVFSRKGLGVTGTIQANLALKGTQSDATNARYDKLRNSGTLKVDNIKLNSELFPKPFVIESGLFSFKQDKIWFDQFKARYGRTDLTLNGYMNNVINYALKPNEKLQGTFDMHSNLIAVDEFMAFAPDEKGTPSGKAQKGVVIVPGNLDIQLKADAKSVQYNGLDIKDAKGQMAITGQKIILKETGFNLIGCNVLMDATYGSVSPMRAFFDYQIDAKEFDIRRAYNEIKLFRTLASAAGKAQGIVSLKYKLSGKLDGNMAPVYPSIVGGGELAIKNVKVAGLKMFSEVSRNTGRDSINNPTLKQVVIKTSIKNNIITIEPVKFKIAGFRPKIEGQTSFDGKLNIKFRLGLPPFGLFGIPMTITGTQDKPKVKMGKGKKEDELQETKEETK